MTTMKAGLNQRLIRAGTYMQETVSSVCIAEALLDHAANTNFPLRLSSGDLKAEMLDLNKRLVETRLTSMFIDTEGDLQRTRMLRLSMTNKTTTTSSFLTTSHCIQFATSAPRQDC